jgi:hypothetical protein
LKKVLDEQKQKLDELREIEKPELDKHREIEKPELDKHREIEKRQNKIINQYKFGKKLYKIKETIDCR